MEHAEVTQRLTDLLRMIGDFSRRGQLKEAAAAAGERLALAETELGPGAEATLSSLLCLGGLLSRLGSFQEATTVYEKARDSASTLSEPVRSIVAYALAGIAENELAQNNREAAQAAVHSALNVIEHSSNEIPVESISELFHIILRVLKELSDDSEINRGYLALLKTVEEMNQDKLPSLISTVIDAAGWFVSKGHTSEAGVLAGRAKDFFARNDSATAAQKASLNSILGRTCLAAGEAAEAARLLADALEGFIKLNGEDSDEAIACRVDLADALLEKTDGTAAALAQATAALKCIRDNGKEGTSPDEARALSIIGEVHLVSGDLQEARTNFRESLILSEKLNPQASVQIARLRHNIGVIGLTDDDPEAVVMLERAADLRKEALGRDDPDYAQTLWALGRCYQNRGRIDDAKRAYRESIDIQELFRDERDPSLAAARQLLESLEAPGREASELPRTNMEPVELPSAPPGTRGVPATTASPYLMFPGNLAGHLMMAALLALENQKPDMASKILREGVGLLGLQRDSREVDIESTLVWITSLIEGLRPGDA